MAVAAQTALPGDSLYPVKRAIEDARTGLTTDDAAQGTRLLANARGRLVEVDQLAGGSSRSRDAAVADTLTSFDEQATEASEILLDAYAESGDEQVITSLRSFTASSLDRLALLERTIPDSARDELVTAGNTLAEIDARAATACPACGGGVGTLPPFLLSAAVPGQDVGTVLSTSSASIIDRGRTGPPAIAATISGQDVGGIVVPELDTTLGAATDGTQDPTGTGTGSPTEVPGTGGGTDGTVGGTVKGTVKGTVEGTVKGAVDSPVDDVTKLLTGDVPTLVNEVPVVGPVVGGVLGDVGGTLDPTTDPLLH
jgi:hypothetical protein